SSLFQILFLVRVLPNKHCRVNLPERQRIRGRLRGSMSTRAYEPPSFCHECGKAYAWTESRLEAARDLADQLNLDVPERTLLDKRIEEIVRDTPRAPAEAVRFRKIVDKAAPWAMDAFNKILIGIISEPVKKLIWPQ